MRILCFISHSFGSALLLYNSGSHCTDASYIFGYAYPLVFQKISVEAK